MKWRNEIGRRTEEKERNGDLLKGEMEKCVWKETNGNGYKVQMR